MSHFVVGVIVPLGLRVQDWIQRVMEPYNEEKEVPEYDRACYCINDCAVDYAIQKTEDKFGKTRGEYREEALNNPQYRSLINRKVSIYDPFGKVRWKDLSAESKEEYKAIEKAVDALWDQSWKPWESAQELFEKEHPLYQKPNPDCSNCKGTGTYRSTRNPKSKWDWFVIGGRWDGWARGEDREATGPHGSPGEENHNLDNNCIQISEIPNPIPEERIPYALVTPDGEWHEKGTMGWFAVSTNENDNWSEVARGLLEQYRGTHLLVGVDCHI